MLQALPVPELLPPSPLTQKPLAQVAPLAQETQALPLLPQVTLLVPVTQTLPEQQPGQLVGPQTPEVVQLPFTHNWAGPQATQRLPPKPQLAGLLPSWHMPLASQQPPQF